MRRRKSLRSPRLELRERKKAATKALALSVFSLLLIVGALYALSRPEFRIDTIEISGSARVPESEVRSLAAEMLSGTYAGIIPKSHTLLYPKTDIKEELVRRFSAFSGVSVSLRNLSAIRIAVREREPVLRTCMDDSCYLLDETGFAFAPAEEGSEASYYTLEGIATTSPLGRSIIEAERLTALRSFLKQLEGIGFEPRRAAFTDADGLEVLLGGNVRFLLREGEYDPAVTRLQALLREEGVVPRRGEDLSVSYIDLRYGNKIYFK